jgi:TIGR03009 family protein
MRRAGFVLASVLSAAPLALAQQPPQPPQTPLQPVGGFGGQPGGGAKPPTGGAALPVSAAKPDEATLKHLEGWEAAMKGVKTFYAAATMVDRDPGLRREVQFTAALYLMKPNLVRMDVTKALPKGQQPAAADQKMYISTGKMLYEYDGAQRKRTSAALGPNGAGGNLLLDIMSGMSAKQVADRFKVSTIKQDDNYVFLEVRPIYQVDKEEFESLTLVLCGAKFGARAYIPRRVVMTKQAGQKLGEAGPSETWDFEDPIVNPAKGITEEIFAPVKLPDGWKDESREAPRTAAPGGALPTGSSRVPTPGSGK